MRSWVCSRLFESAGPGLNVHHGAAFGLGRNIRVGDETNIGIDAYINGRGGVILGDNVLMGPEVMIYTGTHTFSHPVMPIRRQPMRYAPVTIGNDVWLGARSIILPGITIDDGCIVGANSVVTKDLPPRSIAVGSPARVIGNRTSDRYSETKSDDHSQRDET